MKSLKGTKQSPLFLNLYFTIYVLLIVISYVAYVVLDNMRLSHSALFLSGKQVTQTDVQYIDRIGQWTSIFEASFFFLFLISLFILLLLSKSNFEKFIVFLTANVVLIIGIGIIGFIFSFFISSPVGNLLQPIFLPLILISCLFVYLFWKKRREKKIFKIQNRHQ